MRTTPEVSVVIPTRNRAGFLVQAIESALAQNGVELEVIVVDDGSDDETASVLAEADDPRLHVIRFSARRGQSEARNAGVAAARGRWIAFLDDDDLWAPDKLRLQLDRAERAGAGWVLCGVLLVSPEGDVVTVSPPGDIDRLLEQLLQHNAVPAGASTVIVEADRLRAVGGFQDGLNNPWDLWIRLASDGPAAAVDQPLAAYRRHEASFIATNRDVAVADACLIAEKHRALSDRHGVAFDLAGYHRWLDSELVRALRHDAAVRSRRGEKVAAARLQLRALARTRSRADLRRLVAILSGETARRLVRRLGNDSQAAARSEGAIPLWLARYLERDRASGAATP